MPFKTDELSAKAKGGTELMKTALEKKLVERGHKDLVDFFDIYPSRVRNFDASKPSIYWAHDLAGDPEANHLKIGDGKRWAGMVFVSHWQHQQFQQYYNLTGENAHVLYNAIEPFAASRVMDKFQGPLGTESNPIRLIYHTTPHRGLEIVVPVFEFLHNHYQKQNVHIILDVYSSFSIYGWQQRDEPYSEIFERCEAHPAINYHGAVPNEQIREALMQSHIFAFPSIWPETSCLALIEAMASGTICVHSNLAALPETASGMSMMYPFVKDANLHAGRFCGYLQKAIHHCLINPEDAGKMMTSVAERTNSLYSWDDRINEWISLLSSIKSELEA